MPSHPFIPFDKTAQLTAIYSQSGQIVENVYHFTGGAEWDTTSLGALGIAFENWETAHGSAIRNTNTALFKLLIVDLAVADSFLVVSTATIDGTVASEPLPNNVSLAVKWTTNKRGRSFRGRTFHIGLCEAMRDSTDHNSINTGFETSLLFVYDALLTTAWPNGAVPVVASSRTGGAWRTTGVTTPIIAANLTDLVFDSQRRRLPFHNVHR